MPNYDDDYLSVPVKRGSGPVHVMKLAGDAAGARDPRELASLILSASGWKEMRDDLRLRFVEVMVSHVKDIRDATETRNRLLLPIDKGGLGMSPVEADSAMSAARTTLSLKPRQPLQPIKVTGPKPAATAAAGELLGQAAQMIRTGMPPSAEPKTLVRPVAPPAPPAPPRSPAVPAMKPSVPPPSAVTPPPVAAVVPAVSPPAPVAPKPEVAIARPMPPPPAPVAAKPPEAPKQAAAPESKLPTSREEALTMLTNEVVSELAFRFPDRYLEDRLRSTIASRLRDIRDWDETEEVLRKQANAGGISLSAADIEKVRASLEPRVKRIQTELYDRQKKQVLEALEKEREGDKLRSATRRFEEKAATDALFEQVTGKSASSMPVVEAGAARPSAMPPRPGIAAPRAGAPRPPVAPQASPAATPPSAPSMTDVRVPEKLVGPVEELRRLGLVDFRKLSADPTEAVRKIIDKLKLLEEESLPRKLEGIAALKRSELYSVYWNIAQGSMMKGVPVESVMAERDGQRLPVLTKAEFDAIMELNRQLRF